MNIYSKIVFYHLTILHFHHAFVNSDVSLHPVLNYLGNEIVDQLDLHDRVRRKSMMSFVTGNVSL